MIVTIACTQWEIGKTVDVLQEGAILSENCICIAKHWMNSFNSFGKTSK